MPLFKCQKGEIKPPTPPIPETMEVNIRGSVTSSKSSHNVNFNQDIQIPVTDLNQGGSVGNDTESDTVYSNLSAITPLDEKYNGYYVEVTIETYYSSSMSGGNTRTVQLPFTGNIAGGAVGGRGRGGGCTISIKPVPAPEN